MKKDMQIIQWFENLTSDDVSRVGGKNASLGEMISLLKDENIPVPDGFATTAEAYRYFIEKNKMAPKIESILDSFEKKDKTLSRAGKQIRSLFSEATFPEKIVEAVSDAYQTLCRRTEQENMSVAVRSSATAEDLPDASFAGQQETFLNISGTAELLDACKKCYASIFTDRAISYRMEKGFDHMDVALSIGIQKMVRSDQSGSGVMFSIDTETGFPGAVLINAAWGLGETVVQGSVTPDEYRVFKPLVGIKNFVPIVEKTRGAKEHKMIYASGGSRTTKTVSTPKSERDAFVLSDDEILRLATWAIRIENHYDTPMDMEWAKDGETGKMYIVQARPETVESGKSSASLMTYQLKETADPVLTGVSVGQAIGAGTVCRIKRPDDPEDLESFRQGDILVTEMTDPDWVPIMKKAAGIITDSGGRTCHAAIVSRELGIPAVVGVRDGTEKLEHGSKVTLSCAEGDQGYVYDGFLEYDTRKIDLEDVPQIQTKIMMNIASPSAAFRWWRIPCSGIGLARMEFIINNMIQIHPMALADMDNINDASVKKQIESLTKGYPDKKQYFIDHLAQGIGKIAASRYPDPVIVRFSDFKSNEYADLIGGSQFEESENNPMIGFRGASRYYSDSYRAGFDMECHAVKKAREIIGLDNIIVMIPFCRRVEEAQKVIEILADNGLQRGDNGLKVYMMAEIPSNIFLADKFAAFFDGFSIGSNDLTQLVLGIDRDSAALSYLFDENDEAVKKSIKELIQTAHQADIKVGICGQAPSDHDDFATYLVEQGIDSISLNPDSIIPVMKRLAEIEESRVF